MSPAHLWSDPSRRLAEVQLEDDIRDALQSVRGRRPTLEDRRSLLDLDAEVGVGYVFLGFPAASSREADDCDALVAHIAANDLPIEPVLMSRLIDEDLDQLLRLQDEAACPVTADFYLSTSPLRALVEGWEIGRMLERLGAIASRAADGGLRFRIAFEDSTRTPPEDLRRAVACAKELSPTTIVLNDTVGVIDPAGAASQTKFVVDLLKGSTTLVVWHGHNDCGLAVANALAAAEAGAQVISGTFMGVGERAGNVSLEQVIAVCAAAGATRHSLLASAEMCRVFAKAMELEVPNGQPLVGEDVFTTATATHVTAILKSRAIAPDVEDVLWSAVPASALGRSQTITVGPNSSNRGARDVLATHGLEASASNARLLLDEAARQGRCLNSRHEVVAALRAGRGKTAGRRAPVYQDLDRKLNEVTGSSQGVQVLVAPDGHRIRGAEHRAPDRVERHATLRGFQRIVLSLWRSGTVSPGLVRSPSWLPTLAPHSVTDVDDDLLLPMFFRTDESRDGHVFEIQCPGSWWGTHQALQEQFGPAGHVPIADGFAVQLRRCLPGRADLLHLFASASNPHENHYFAQRVRAADPEVRFWGIDPGLRAEDCTLVRSHSYNALVAEDAFLTRLTDLRDRRGRFDLPPVQLFDQKLPMCLPFMPETAAAFSPAHRALFPYTTLINRDDVQLASGDVVALEDLAHLEPADRQYFLKYAGTDTRRNFGSKGTFDLRERTDDEVRELLEHVARDWAAGEPWLLQRAVDSKDALRFIADGGELRGEALNVKVSAFYGPDGELGMMTLADPAPEVHWSKSSIVALTHIEPPSPTSSA